MPADEDALLYAKRLIVQRCLYGVDRNELAAELGKLSLWRATTNSRSSTIASATATRWLGSTAGRSRRSTWARSRARRGSICCKFMMRDRLAKVEREREHIRSALEDAPEEQQRLVLPAPSRLSPTPNSSETQ